MVGEMFRLLTDAAVDTAGKKQEEEIETIAKDVEHHRDGAEPNDDLTMMCLYIKSQQ